MAAAFAAACFSRESSRSISFSTRSWRGDRIGRKTPKTPGNGSTIIGLLFIVQLGSLATMLADIWQNVPQIIKEAATSPLGLLALMIIALAILAFFFFKDAGVPVRIAIFITLFAAVVVFAAKIAYKANEVAQSNSDGSHAPTTTADSRRTWRILREKEGRQPRPHSVFLGKAGTRYTIWYDEGDGDSIGIDNSNALDPQFRNLIPLAKGTFSEYTIESGDNLGIYLRQGATYAKGHIEERK